MTSSFCSLIFFFFFPGSDFKAKGCFETALQWAGLVSEDKVGAFAETNDK